MFYLVKGLQIDSGILKEYSIICSKFKTTTRRDRVLLFCAEERRRKAVPFHHLSELWRDTLNGGNLKEVVDLYHEDCVFLPTFHYGILCRKKGANFYHGERFMPKKPKCELVEERVIFEVGDYVSLAGHYDFTLADGKKVRSRYTMGWKGRRLILHHSSPE